MYSSDEGTLGGGGTIQECFDIEVPTLFERSVKMKKIAILIAHVYPLEPVLYVKFVENFGNI